MFCKTGKQVSICRVDSSEG